MLTDLLPASRVRANRANLYEFFRYFAQSPAMEFSQGDGLTRWSCSFQYAWFNAVLCARNATPADDAYIEACLAYFKAKNTDEISWWLEEEVDLAGWQALLAPRGFHWAAGPIGMSVDLQRLRGTGPLSHSSEVKIVSNEQDAQDCASVLVQGYGFPPSWQATAMEWLLGMGLGYNHPYRSYVAYWRGKPVATAGAFFGEGTVGIYSVTTLPAARRQGFGAAVTLAPLVEARKMGYRMGILQSSEMGYPVYQKLGFQQDFRVGSFFYKFD